MCFRLVYGDFDFHVVLPFEPHLEERLYSIISQTGSPDSVEIAPLDLARRIVDVVTVMLEGQALPPTDKQLKYALAIAQELGLELPAHVLQYRDAMNVFLSSNAETYRRSKGLRRSAGSGTQ